MRTHILFAPKSMKWDVDAEYFLVRFGWTVALAELPNEIVVSFARFIAVLLHEKYVHNYLNASFVCMCVCEWCTLDQWVRLWTQSVFLRYDWNNSVQMRAPATRMCACEHVICMCCRWCVFARGTHVLASRFCKLKTACRPETTARERESWFV